MMTAPIRALEYQRGMMRQLILFDVDGTLTNTDTMFEYAGHAAGRARLMLAMVLTSPVLVGMRLGLFDRGWSKGLMLRVCFAGMRQETLVAAAEQLAAERLPALLRLGAREAVQAYLEAGDRVILVSASLDLWLKPIAAALGTELICTCTAWSGGRFAGLDGPNCRGAEKERRVRQQVDTDNYRRVIAYGDSSGDRELLAMADEGHFQPFRTS